MGAGEEVTEREGCRRAGEGILSVAFMVKREVNAWREGNI